MKPYYYNGISQLLQGDCREISLEDGSVHCVVTSPPYYALRVYADATESTLGNEPTPEEYLGHLLECFAEVWRVMRDDGVLWVNLGDTRASGGSNYSDNQGKSQSETRSGVNGNAHRSLNLLAIPERFALAMQAWGWTWRDTVIWAKKSAMPESLGGTRWERCRVKVANGRVPRHGFERGNGHVDESDVEHRDDGAKWTGCPGCPKCELNDGLVLRRGSWRSTSSFEYIYMFTKTGNYYCDGDAVKTASTERASGNTNRLYPSDRDGELGGGQRGSSAPYQPNGTGANRRNVWNDISPEPYGGSHYATFPSDLPRICIQASTSERGCCPKCGAQWARVVNYQAHYKQREPAHTPNHDLTKADSTGWEPPTNETLGWRATCEHGDLEPVPATVCDPFAGTATTLLAAQRLGRRGVGMELSLSYLQQAEKRLTGVTLPLRGLNDQPLWILKETKK